MNEGKWMKLSLLVVVGLFCALLVSPAMAQEEEEEAQTITSPLMRGCPTMNFLTRAFHPSNRQMSQLRAGKSVRMTLQRIVSFPGAGFRGKKGQKFLVRRASKGGVSIRQAKKARGIILHNQGGNKKLKVIAGRGLTSVTGRMFVDKAGMIKMSGVPITHQGVAPPEMRKGIILHKGMMHRK